MQDLSIFDKMVLQKAPHGNLFFWPLKIIEKITIS